MRATKQMRSGNVPADAYARLRIAMFDDDLYLSLGERTLVEYSRVYWKLRKATYRSGLSCTPEALANYVEARFSNRDITRATGRLWRAACFFGLTEDARQLEHQDKCFDAQVQAYQRIFALSTRGLPIRSENTTSTRLKSFPAEVFDLLVRYVASRPRSAAAVQALRYVRAGLLLGLRPHEWFQGPAFATRLHSNRGEYARNPSGELRCTPMIIIPNSKVSDGRSNGEYREVILYGVMQREVDDIHAFLADVDEAIAESPAGMPVDVVADRFFKRLNRAIGLALREAGYNGSPITAYSVRHQAVANAKASGMTVEEIAAYFGHRSTHTARRHYGRKDAAWGATKFRPSPESVAEVRPAPTSRREPVNMADWLGSIESRLQAEP